MQRPMGAPTPDVAFSHAALRAALHESERRLKALRQDRERISRDLHDGVLQSLYAVGLKLRASQLLAQKTPERAAEHLQQATVQLEQAVTEIRGFLRSDLGHDRVVAEGLEPSLRSLVTTMTAGTGIDYQLSFHPHAERLLPADHVRQVLHMVREAISNSVRHAHATELRISVDVVGDHVRIEVSDNGMGFRPRSRAGSGFGLRNLAVRAQQLGGRLRIVSAPWRGTRVLFERPAASP